MIRRCAPLLTFLVLIGCSRTGTDMSGPRTSAGIALVEVVSGLSTPVYLTSPAGDPRLFVVEKNGRVRVIRDGVVLPTPFLDLSAAVSSGGEQGLLSIAFHPDYASNGFMYASYTDRAGATQIVRYAVSADPDAADPSSAVLVLSVAQPFSNHNGGLILFGGDGFLYVGLGDGGSGADPLGHGQNTGTLLGSLLRIDVDGGSPYAIPGDNPFANDPSARAEIWAYGLRNPWRWAFDEGLLYVADVGQDAWEEVNVVPAGQGGLNYGWNLAEGDHCFGPPTCDRSDFVVPALEYAHPSGCAITGGFVYRGSDLPEISGHYFYSDFCAGWIRSFRYDGAAVTDTRQWDFPDVGGVTSFGADAAGELYVLSESGTVYRLARDAE